MTAVQAAPPKRRRGKVAQSGDLSRDKILYVAMQMTRDVGLDGISMRKLADALNVGTMSAYHHFATRDDLIDEIINHVVFAAANAPTLAIDPWQQLEDLLRHVYATMVQFPGVARAFYDRSVLEPRLRQPQRIALADRFARIFHDVGMDAVEARSALAIALGLILTLSDRTTRRQPRAHEFDAIEKAEHDLYNDAFPHYFWSTNSDVSFEAIDLIGSAIGVLIAGLKGKQK